MAVNYYQPGYRLVDRCLNDPRVHEHSHSGGCLSPIVLQKGQGTHHDRA
jgi:hypothetical protein